MGVSNHILGNLGSLITPTFRQFASSEELASECDLLERYLAILDNHPDIAEKLRNSDFKRFPRLKRISGEDEQGRGECERMIIEIESAIQTGQNLEE